MSLASTHHELDELNGGRYRSTIHMKPIASYKNGSLRRDPMLLTATGSADWPIACDGIMDVRVDPRLSGKSPVLHVGHGRDFARFALIGANNVKGSVKDNSTLFVNAWNNADLRYEYGGHLLRESISLRSNHPKSFGFILQEHTGFDPVTMTIGSLRIQQPSLERDEMTVPLSWLVTQQGGKWLLTCVLPEGDWAGWTVDPTLELQPGAADGKDTFLRGGGSAGNILDTATVFECGVSGERTCLIEFNLSSLPAGAVISSATLTLTTAIQKAVNGTATFYRILTANSAWIEACNWNYAVPSTTRWAGDVGADGGRDAGCTQLGTDVAVTSIGSLTHVSNEAVGTTHDAALTLTEFGLLLAANEGIAFWFSSGTTYQPATSDHATAAWRPKLVVEYTLPGGGGIFASSIFHSAIHGQNLTR